MEMLLFLLACLATSPAQARRAWLAEALIEDNLVWLSRPHARLAEKYARMAHDPYDFLRGTTALFYADLGRPDPARPDTVFASTAAAASVLIVGDPHPENLGSCLPGEPPDGAVAPPLPLRLEWVDLDGAGFGPWVADLRRANLGLLAFAGEGCDTGCQQAASAALGEGYGDEISARTWNPTSGNGSVILDALLAQATEDGSAVAALVSATALDADGRHLLLDEALDADGRGVLALSGEEDAQLSRLLSAWVTGRPPGFRRLDAAREFGTGVASLPAVRYRVLWDRGEDAPDDDHLLELREVVNPPSLPGQTDGVPSRFDSGAARVEAVSAWLWSRPDADARMAGLSDGGQTFKVMSEDAWFAEASHLDVASALSNETLSADEVAGLGRALGAALAAAHARGPTANGDASADAITADLAERREILVEELIRDGAWDLDRLRSDHALFLDLLDEHGSLLGADALGDDLP